MYLHRALGKYFYKLLLFYSTFQPAQEPKTAKYLSGFVDRKAKFLNCVNLQMISHKPLSRSTHIHSYLCT